MKYLPLRDLENVTNALNFTTSDCYVVGSCDLYTTKATGNDRKLYKSIETSLESQHESLLRLSESLSPPNAEMFTMNLERLSPFGPLSQVSNRRTFAYLVATLNASHPDYDFSHFLRPSDFRKERSLKSVMHAVDETIYNLRPRQTSAFLTPAGGWGKNDGPAVPQTPGGSPTWSPRMWRLIDKEMSLKECEIYCYAPNDDPFDGEESAIWSLNYFFFNKERKRVLSMHVRALSISSHSPALIASAKRSKRLRPTARSLSLEKAGAAKRAKFWLGDRALRAESEQFTGKSGPDDDDDDVIHEPGDDEVDADEEMGPSDLSIGDMSESEDDDDNDYDDNVDDDEIEQRLRSERSVHEMSEHMAESMDV